MPMAGIGTSRRSRPGPAPVLTRASIGSVPADDLVDVDSPRSVASRSSTSSVQSMTGFSTEPMPSISQRTRSPGWRKTGGSRKTPTPAGVPVAMRSPGSRVIDRLMYSISSATPQIMSDGVAVLHQDARGRRPAPDPGIDPRAQAEGLRVRDLVGGDEDRAHRQERVGALGAQPLAVADLALGEGRRDALPVAGADVVDDHVARDVVERLGRATRAWAVVPMTTPSSTSRSRAVVPSGRTIGSPSAMTALANFEKRSGRVGECPAALGGMLPVVEPDADDLARDGERRDDARRRRAAIPAAPLSVAARRRMSSSASGSRSRPDRNPSKTGMSRSPTRTAVPPSSDPMNETRRIGGRLGQLGEAAGDGLGAGDALGRGRRARGRGRAARGRGPDRSGPGSRRRRRRLRFGTGQAASGLVRPPHCV